MSDTKPKRTGAKVSCWACSAVCPTYNRPALSGWGRRDIKLRGQWVPEIYCDACLSMWGWPPLPDGEESER